MKGFVSSYKKYENILKLKVFSLIFDFTFKFVNHNFKYFKFSKI